MGLPGKKPTERTVPECAGNSLTGSHFFKSQMATVPFGEPVIAKSLDALMPIELMPGPMSKRFVTRPRSASIR